MGQAIKAAKDFLGINDLESAIRPRRYDKPDWRTSGAVKVELQSHVMHYLTQTRKIDQATIRAFRVAEHQLEVVFPSFSPEGELINLKYIGITRGPDGKKSIHQVKGCAPGLFGWQALKKLENGNLTREVLITEGQIDAITWHQRGFAALSVPNGVGDDSWIEFEWDNLAQFDTIYLNFDNDEAGQKAVVNIVERLGKSRCLVVKFEKFKDANDAHMADVEKSVFERAITSAKPIAPKQIKSPHDFRDGIYQAFGFTEREHRGLYPAIFGGNIGFRPGEFTVWTGFSNHGKSVILSQVMTEAMQNNQRVAIASMEMTGAQTLMRMICQILKEPKPTQRQVDDTIDWMVGRLWVYDVIGNVSSTLLFDLINYSVARHDVDHFVIDSLMKTDVGVEDYQGQKVFADRCSTFAIGRRRHVHLVAHARKKGVYFKASEPSQEDVKGNSDVTNMADNILIMFRNKKKSELPEAERRGKYDAKVICEKQRNQNWEGQIQLWYRKEIYTFAAKNPEDEIGQADLPILPHWVGCDQKVDVDQNAPNGVEAPA